LKNLKITKDEINAGESPSAIANMLKKANRTESEIIDILEKAGVSKQAYAKSLLQQGETSVEVSKILRNSGMSENDVFSIMSQIQAELNQDYKEFGQ
jgi:GTPase Era involved in 16S rRNA processing